MLRVRADCKGSLLHPAKLGIVIHNLAHQLLDHLLADEAILLARQFCDGLCDRVDDFIVAPRCRFYPGPLSQPQARTEKPPPITNLYDCTARKRQCHRPP